VNPGTRPSSIVAAAPGRGGDILHADPGLPTVRASGASSHPAPPADALPLVELLSRVLRRERIDYCHWKSNAAIARSIRGENDLDLLIAGEHATTFREALEELGFVSAAMPAQYRLPAVEDFYGLDDTGKLVHVHAHFRLVLGDDATKNYRLPIEEAYLGSAREQGLLRIPAPEFEYVVFVIRMVLKHNTPDAIAGLRGSLSHSERQELAFLQERIQRGHVDAILEAHAPYIAGDFFAQCEDSLGNPRRLRLRTRTAAELERRLAPWSERDRRRDTALRVWRRVLRPFRKYILRKPPRRRLTAGGKLVAIVGGDGAGKSSAVAGLVTWLSKVFVVDRAHLGKPPQSLSAITVRAARVVRRASRRGVLRRARAPEGGPHRSGQLDLLWNALLARDRYREYLRVSALVARGGIVVCDRFPLPGIDAVDGPRSVSPSVDGQRLGPAVRLMRWERSFYDRIGAPDVLIVLKVDPEVAVKRRSDEDAAFVRARSAEFWDRDWSEIGAQVIDAGHSREDVLREVKCAIWREL
jgi:thymidylate kinase